MNKTEQEDWKNFALNFPLYEELRGKSIAVTGATGLLGSCMTHCLLELNREKDLHLQIIAIVRNLEKAKRLFQDAPIIYKVYDFSQQEALALDEKADYLIHFASPTASQYFVTQPVETMLTGLYGTEQVLKLAREQGMDSLVYVSSLEVYGSVYDDTDSLTEDKQGYIDPMQARSSYPIAKRAAECLCHAYAKEYATPVKTARLAQTFGAGVAKDDNRVFAQFARNVINGEDIVLHTTGELSRCYCYTTDAVEAILYILLRGKDGEAYNVANEESYISVIDMARFLCKNFNSSIKPVIELKEGMGYSPMTKLRLSCEKIHQLGWAPKHDLHAMFDKLIQSLGHDLHPEKNL